MRQSAAIEARLAAQREAKTDPPLVEPPVPEPAPQNTDPTPPAPPAASAPPEDPRHSTVEYWQQRFKVTEGLLRREREDHAATQQSLGQKIADLQSQVSTLQASTATPADVDITRYFTPEEIDKFGEDQCRKMASVAQAAADDKVKTLIDAQIAPIRQRQETEAQAEVNRRKTAFTDRLLELYPNYVAVDDTDGWRAWLRQKDPTARIERGTILHHLVQAQDADGVAGMFQQYEALSKPPVPPVAPNGTAAPAAEAPAPAQAVGKALTPAEIRDFYKRAAIGKVTDQERAAFEARTRQRAGMPA